MIIKQEIVRKDGITYTRELNSQNLDGNIFIRYNTERLNKIKELASKKGVKYQTLIRNKIDELLED